MESNSQTEASLPSNDINNIPIIFREIHKNAWLRRLHVNNDRKTGAYSKRGETVWVVFCVHDDTDPYLEVYLTQKVATAHRPDWCAPLTACLHVTPTICATQDGYHEFVVTLRSGVVKLAAPTWDGMMEWVNTLRSKLTEMKILNPAENVYSQMPQIMRPLLPTRDPNSPLPPTPAGPLSLVPGIDLDISSGATSSDNANAGPNVASRAPAPVPTASTSGPTSIQTPNTSGPSVIQTNSADPRAPVNRIQPSSTQSSVNLTSNILVQSSSARVQPSSTQSQATAALHSLLNPVHANSAFNSILTPTNSRNQQNLNINLTVQLGSAENSVQQNSVRNPASSVNQPLVALPNSRVQPHSTYVTVQQNSTVNQASSAATSILQPIPASNTRLQQNSAVQLNPNSHSLNPSSRVQPSSAANVSRDSRVELLSSIPSIPRVQPISRAQSFSSGSAVQSTSTQVEQSSAVANLRSASSTTSLYITQEQVNLNPRTAPNLNRTISEPSQNITVIEVSGPMEPNVFDFTNMADNLTPIDAPYYEHLYPSQSEPISPLTPLDTPIVNLDTPIDPIASTSNNETPISSMLQIGTPIASNPIDTPIIGSESTEGPILSPRNERHRTRFTPIDTPVESIEAPSLNPRNERQRPTPNESCEAPSLTPRNERQRSTPNESSEAPILSPRNERRRARGMVPGPRVLGSVPCPFRPTIAATFLTLRDQQVLQLTREIRHPSGVRLQIRRKDCCGSIALVDAFGAVWVAGWKQREHPTLYNALHIGDRVLSVAGLPVPSAADANRIIRTANCLFIEFIVRRVPFGRILAIKREIEGQDLGLELEGGSSEIKVVRDGSPAARAGLPPKAPTCDGLSLCNWVLTEVNSRPLNLFFKEHEARDRLNAVGMDVSILVQPFDLVKQLKKQLKSFRGYKDYLVQ